MQTLDLIVRIGGLVYAVVGTVLAIRLLAMWRRTRKSPELLIGLAFFTGGTLYTTLSLVLAGGVPRHSPVLLAALTTAAAAARSGPGVCLALAAWRIFRPTRRWAAALAVFIAVLAGGSVIARSVLDGRGAALWALTGAIAAILGFGWMGIEAFLYYGMVRRQLRLGFATPVLLNRMWLWGWSHVLAALLVAGIVVAQILVTPAHVELAVHLLSLPLAYLVSVCNWLVFLPPRGYLSAIERRAARARQHVPA